MTKRRMQQLAGFGALPTSQVEELTKRGYLLQVSAASTSKLKQSLLQQSNQKFQQEQEQLDAQLSKLEDKRFDIGSLLVQK